MTTAKRFTEWKVMSAHEYKLSKPKWNGWPTDIPLNESFAEEYAAYHSALAVNEVIEKDAQAIEQFNVLADSPKELAAIIRARKVTP